MEQVAKTAIKTYFGFTARNYISVRAEQANFNCSLTEQDVFGMCYTTEDDNEKKRRTGVATLKMALAGEAKRQVVARNQTHKTDTGSPEVQIAILSARILELTEHFKTHKKDHSSRRGLLTLVAKRRRLLTYLKTNSPERYKSVLAKLNIRH